MRKFRDVHVLEVINGASTAFILKVLAAGLGFVLNIVLARLLTPEELGAYYLSLAIVVIVSTIGRLGMGNTLVRFISARRADENWEELLGVYNKAISYAFLSAFSFAVLLFLSASWLSEAVFNKSDLAPTLTFLSLSVVPYTLFTLHSAALQGLKKIKDSLIVLSIIVPLVLLVISLMFTPLYGLKAVLLGNFLAATLSLIYGRIQWNKFTLKYKEYKPSFDNKTLFASSVPLMIMMVLGLITEWSSVIFLGIWEDSKNVAIYSVSMRIAMLISFILVAVNSISSPKFSELFISGNRAVLENIVQKSNILMILILLPVTLIFVVFSDIILLVFGESFVDGKYVLILLCLGQFVNVATGSVGFLLIMSGHERLMRNNSIFIAILALILNYLLIQDYGMLGAAFSTAICISMKNIIALIFVKKYIKIKLYPFNII